MSFTNKNINQVSETKPTYQEVEQALINVVKAGLYYRKPACRKRSDRRNSVEYNCLCHRIK